MLNKIFGVALLTVNFAAQGDILPPNNLHLFDTVLSSNITEDQFNNIISQVEGIYAPIMIETHGARPIFTRNWTDPTVNASARQSFGTWTVNMSGGLARRPEITPDAFALVVCHEVGHHLGGFPFKEVSAGPFWPATEGQSDYFATHSCAKLLWSDEFDKNAEYRSKVAEVPRALCDSVWSKESDQDLCYRVMEGSESMASMFAALESSQISFATPDSKVAASTRQTHPPAQCRLDTLAAAALCLRDFDTEIIPGEDVIRVDRNGIPGELATAPYTCSRADGIDVGFRPQCWFKSKL